MREIVLDTETTGLDPSQGHRLVELGCIELLNRIPTGATFHSYLNPEREVPAEAFAIHGLATEFLKDKPRFADIADDFLAFIGDAPLVIHNAELRPRLSSAPSSSASSVRRSRASGWSTRCCWRAASIRPARTGSTICARATASTIRAAPSTARCSTPRSWPRSIWS